MKALYFILISGILVSSVIGQVPESFKYQAVLRDSQGAVRSNTSVNIKISILEGSATGSQVFIETHSVTTNEFGLVNLEIGSINPSVFASIDWAYGPYFLKVTVDGTEMGTSQLLSVPYALHSKKAETADYNNLSNLPSLFDGTWTSLTGKPVTISGYGIIDAMSTAHAANGITSTNISNWNNAYGWGNHIGLYRPISYVPSWNEITSKPTTLEGYGITDAFDGAWVSLTGKPTFSTVATSGSYNDLKDIPIYSVGDFIYGGIVFWVDATGQHGLVCAKSDQSTSMRWYAGTYSYTMARGDGPLSGKMNTSIIIANQGLGDGNTYAARVCAELQITEGGITFGDWYLPSKAELGLMYQNREIINTTATANGGNSFANNSYWSSTEDADGNVWTHLFQSGLYGNGSKEYTLHVRAIRSF